MSVDFIRFVATLKTVRGVIITKTRPSEDVLKWLRRSIRWRPIGCSAGMIATLKKYGFSSKLIQEIAYPFETFAGVSEMLEEEGLSREVAEALVLSSAYIVPIILLDDDTFRELEKKQFVVCKVKTQKKMRDKDIKLHMRIAEYSVKDYHFEVIERAEKAVLSGELSKELKWRKKLCVKDSKRYWRIKQDRGETVLAYVDPLKLLKNRVDNLADLVKKDRRVILTLGIPVCLVVSAMLRSQKCIESKK